MVAADLGRLLAGNLSAAQDAHRRFENEQREERRSEDEEQRSEALPEGLRHLG